MLIALSEPVQLALITASVPAFIAIVGLVTLWLNLKAAARKLTDIEAKVDGTASKALEKNEAQARELKEFMLSVLAEKEERARILAKAAADAMTLATTRRSRADDTAPAVASAGTAATTVSVDEALAKLDAIEDHTAKTAANTSRTDANVQDLKDQK